MGEIGKKVIKNQDAIVIIDPLESGKNRIYVEAKKNNLFMPFNTWETSYNINLIKKILEIKGPAYLCDEIMQDESFDYLQKSFKYSILGYTDEKEFEKKRILDFGCGSGASTMILARMFPKTNIIGIDLERKLLELAKLRAKHYNFTDITFLQSPTPNSLPQNIGEFDYVILSAVFEHLLPRERTELLPKIWKLLKPKGVLFINRTPYRYFPIETHTTGLPFINYLPKKLSLWYTQKLSKRNLAKDNWETLLRKGIRGSNVREIYKILQNTPQKPILLQPQRLGLKDRVDLWYNETNTKRFKLIKKALFFSLKSLKILTRFTLVPSLSLAIKKSN